MKFKVFYMQSKNRTRFPKNFNLPGIESEEYEYNDVEVPDPERWAKETFAHFNNTLRSGELPRILIGVKIIEVGTRPNHNWEKTNLVTISKGMQTYDTGKCTVCGITGKRFGIGNNFTRDSKFADDAFSRCDTSLKKLFPKRRV